MWPWRSRVRIPSSTPTYEDQGSPGRSRGGEKPAVHPHIAARVTLTGVRSPAPARAARWLRASRPPGPTPILPTRRAPPSAKAGGRRDRAGTAEPCGRNRAADRACERWRADADGGRGATAQAAPPGRGVRRSVGRRGGQGDRAGPGAPRGRGVDGPRSSGSSSIAARR